MKIIEAIKLKLKFIRRKDWTSDSFIEPALWYSPIFFSCDKDWWQKWEPSPEDLQAEDWEEYTDYKKTQKRLHIIGIQTMSLNLPGDSHFTIWVGNAQLGNFEIFCYKQKLLPLLKQAFAEERLIDVNYDKPYDARLLTNVSISEQETKESEVKHDICESN